MAWGYVLLFSYKERTVSLSDEYLHFHYPMLLQLWVFNLKEKMNKQLHTSMKLFTMLQPRGGLVDKHYETQTSSVYIEQRSGCSVIEKS